MDLREQWLNKQGVQTTQAKAPATNAPSKNLQEKWLNKVGSQAPSTISTNPTKTQPIAVDKPKQTAGSKSVQPKKYNTMLNAVPQKTGFTSTTNPLNTVSDQDFRNPLIELANDQKKYLKPSRAVSRKTKQATVVYNEDYTPLVNQVKDSMRKKGEEAGFFIPKYFDKGYNELKYKGTKIYGATPEQILSGTAPKNSEYKKLSETEQVNIFEAIRDSSFDWAKGNNDLIERQVNLTGGIGKAKLSGFRGTLGDNPVTNALDLFGYGAMQTFGVADQDTQQFLRLTGKVPGDTGAVSDKIAQGLGSVTSFFVNPAAGPTGGLNITNFAKLPIVTTAGLEAESAAANLLPKATSKLGKTVVRNTSKIVNQMAEQGTIGALYSPALSAQQGRTDVKQVAEDIVTNSVLGAVLAVPFEAVGMGFKGLSKWKASRTRNAEIDRILQNQNNLDLIQTDLQNTHTTVARLEQRVKSLDATPDSPKKAQAQQTVQEQLAKYRQQLDDLNQLVDDINKRQAHSTKSTKPTEDDGATQYQIDKQYLENEIKWYRNQLDDPEGFLSPKEQTTYTRELKRLEQILEVLKPEDYTVSPATKSVNRLTDDEISAIRTQAENEWEQQVQNVVDKRGRQQAEQTRQADVAQSQQEFQQLKNQKQMIDEQIQSLSSKEQRTATEEQELQLLNQRSEEIGQQLQASYQTVFDRLPRVDRATIENNRLNRQNEIDRRQQVAQQQAQQRQDAGGSLASVLRQRLDVENARQAELTAQQQAKEAQARAEFPDNPEVPTSREGRIKFVLLKRNITKNIKNVQKKLESIRAQSVAKEQELLAQQADIPKQMDDYVSDPANVSRAVAEYEDWFMLYRKVFQLTQGKGVKLGKGQKLPSIIKKGEVPIESVARALGMDADTLIQRLGAFNKTHSFDIPSRKAVTIRNEKQNIAIQKLLKEEPINNLKAEMKSVQEQLDAISEIKPAEGQVVSEWVQGTYYPESNGLANPTAEQLVTNRLNIVQNGQISDEMLTQTIREVLGEQTTLDDVMKRYMDEVYPERIVDNLEPLPPEPPAQTVAKPTPKATEGLPTTTPEPVPTATTAPTQKPPEMPVSEPIKTSTTTTPKPIEESAPTAKPTESVDVPPTTVAEPAAPKEAPINQPGFAEELRNTEPDMPMETPIDGLPTNGERIERGFNETVRTSDNTDPVFQEELQRQTDVNETTNIVNNPNWYEKQTNVVLMKRAKNLIDQFGSWQAAYNYILQKYTFKGWKSPLMSDVDITMSQILIRHFMKEADNLKLSKTDLDGQIQALQAKSSLTDTEQRLLDSLTKQSEDAGKLAEENLNKSIEIINKVAPGGTELGRAIQAFSLWNKFDVETMLYMAQRQIDKSAIKRGNKSEPMTAELTEKIRQQADDKATADEINSLVKEVKQILTKTDGVLTEAEKATLFRFNQLVKKIDSKTPKKPTPNDVINETDNIPPRERKRDAFLIRMKALADNARDRLRRNRNRLSSTPFDQWGDYVILGAEKIANGTVKFADWSEQMMKEILDRAGSLKQQMKLQYQMTKLYRDSIRRYRKERGIPQTSEVDRIINKALKDGNMTQDEADALLKLSQEVGYMTDDFNRQVLRDITQTLNRLDKPTIGEYLSKFQTMAQLNNPKTFIRNALGNELFYRLERLVDMALVPFDMIASKLGNAPREFFIFTGASRRGGNFWTDWVQGFRAGWEGMEINQLGTSYDVTRKVFNGKWNPLNHFENLLGGQLKSFDYAAYNRAYFNEAYSWAKGIAKYEGLSGDAALQRIDELIANMDENIAKAFEDYGRYVTFQDDTALAQAFVQLKGAMNFGRKFGIGDLILKYPKTPANLLMRSIDYSPIGFFKGFYQLKDAFREKSFAPFKKQVFRSFGRATVGTVGFTLFGQYLYGLGILTGSPNRKDKDIRSLQEETGAKPYSVNLSALWRWAMSGFDAEQAKLQKSDEFATFDWLQPMAVNIAIGTRTGEINKDNLLSGETSYGLLETSWDSFVAGTNAIVEQPLLTGTQQLLSTYPTDGNDARGTIIGNVANVLTGAPSSFIPALSSQFRNVLDNNKRISVNQKDYLETAWNKVLDRLPFASETLPIDYTAMGLPKKKFQDGGKGGFGNLAKTTFDSFVNPAFFNTYQGDPVLDSVYRFVDRTGIDSVVPRVADKSIKINKYDVQQNPQRYKDFIIDKEMLKLDNEQYSDLQKITGDNMKKYLNMAQVNQVLNNPNVPDEIKKNYMERIMKDIVSYSNNQFRMKYGIPPQ